MADQDILNGNGDANGGPSASPQTIHFSETPPRSQVITDRAPIPPRSLSTTTLSEESAKEKDHKPQECNDKNCTFGWETYVLDHACGPSKKESKAPVDKLLIHNLLHEEEHNPLLGEYEEGMIRHVHLPANNMKWVEDLIRIYYHKKDKDGDKQSRLLRSDFWHGQQHGRGGPIHARFMRHRCDIVPEGLNELSATHRDFVISMPYLHWETDEAREKMLNVIKDIESPERSGTRTSTGVEVKNLRLSKWGKTLLPKAIIYGTAKKADADEKLLRKHLLSERPVHIRRTLDQSYYWTLKDTSSRDRDQVVYRATKDQNPRIVMVDQPWLWILDGKLVITSFPRRWGRKKQDPSGLYRTIREQLASDRPDLNNVYDMATMMMDQCSRVFFDRAVSRDNRPEVLDIFSTAIGDVTDRSTKAYNEFWELIMPDSHRYREMLNKGPKEIWPYLTDAARRKLDKMKNEDALLEQLLDINPEGELLREIKDIQDELHMMTKVYSQQQAVVKEFVTHLDQLSSKSTEVTQKTKDKVSHLAKEVVRRKAEINELTKAAERTAEGLKELLDLKQKHANVEEARAGVLEARQAVIRAVEANKILLATRDLAQQSALQTIQGNKQNRALMLFTIVTIIFLPLGFFSSVFGMNAPEFGQGNFHLWKQFLIMFPVSIVVIVFSLALALSEDFLAFCGATLKLWWAKFLQRVGLFDRWKKKGDNVRRAIAVRKEKLDELYQGENRVGESV